MRSVLWLGIVLGSVATASAQELAAVRAEVLAISGQPTTAPRGWTLHASDLATTVSPASVRALGPGVRITTALATAIYRPEVPLNGDGTVGALVFVDAATPGFYGITLGGENGLAFLVQSGAAAITPLRNGQVASVGWAPGPIVSLPGVGLLRPCRIEARVRGTTAELLVNGIVAASTTITPGALDGVPGIFSGPGALSVVGLMVKSAVPVPPTGR